MSINRSLIIQQALSPNQLKEEGSYGEYKHFHCFFIHWVTQPVIHKQLDQWDVNKQRPMQGWQDQTKQPKNSRAD